MLKVENVSKFFSDKSEALHELRSCSKLLVAMAVGILIDQKTIINDGYREHKFINIENIGNDEFLDTLVTDLWYGPYTSEKCTYKMLWAIWNF